MFCFRYFWGRGRGETGLFSFKPLLPTSWKSVSILRQKLQPTQPEKRKHRSKQVLGMLHTKPNQDSTTILNAVQNQALTFWPIKFYILFASSELSFLIHHAFPGTLAKSESCCIPTMLFWLPIQRNHGHTYTPLPSILLFTVVIMQRQEVRLSPSLCTLLLHLL